MNTKNRDTTILLVDDDKTVLSMLEQGLSELGYRVIPASQGADAIALHQDNDIDIVVTDILMPEKDGLELMMALREKGSASKIIAMSGSNPANNYLKHAKLFGAKETLQKPFQLEVLTQAIDRVLGKADD